MTTFNDWFCDRADQAATGKARRGDGRSWKTSSSVSTTRSKAALVLGVFAWAAFAVMVIGPAFEDEYDQWFDPRLIYAFMLTPVVALLALASFVLGNGPDPIARWATRVSVVLAAAIVIYWVVPWAWNVVTSDY